MLASDPVFFELPHPHVAARVPASSWSAVIEGISQPLSRLSRSSGGFFDARTIHYTGFSEADVQAQYLIIHPVIDYSTRRNADIRWRTGLQRQLLKPVRASADFDPISSSAYSNGYCGPTTADPAVKTPANCLLRGVPGDYNRLSAESHRRRQIVDASGRYGRRSHRCVPTSPTSRSAIKSASRVLSCPATTNSPRSCRR